MWEKRPHLEPIQEESEVEDECERSETEEMQDTVFQSPAGHEDDEDDEEGELTVLRPKRVSRSCSQSFSQVQLNRSQQEETGQLSSSRQNTSTPPKRSFNFSKLRLQTHAPPKAAVERRATRRRQKGYDVRYAQKPTHIFIFPFKKFTFLCVGSFHLTRNHFLSGWQTWWST